MADFPMPLPDGWQADGAYPASVDSKGAGLTLGTLQIASLVDQVLLALVGFDDGLSELFTVQPSKNATPFNEILIDKQGTLVGRGDGLGDGDWRLEQYNGGAQALFELDSHKVIFYASSVAGVAYDQWTANTFYYFGQYVRPTSENGHAYLNLSAGVSGSSEPTWPTNGTDVVDGACDWIDTGAYRLSPTLTVYGTSGMGSGFVPRSEIVTFWKDNFGAGKVWSIGSYGEEILWATSEPADADIATGSRAQYYDDTTGAPRLWIKQRDAAGTLTKRFGAVRTELGTLDMSFAGNPGQIVNVADPGPDQPTDVANQRYVQDTGIGRVFVTFHDQYLQPNSQLILEDYYEIGSGFKTELDVGALLSVDTFTEPTIGFNSGVDRNGGFLEILKTA